MPKTVLIVDDEPLIRRSLIRAARGRDIRFIEAEDGSKGLELWTEHLPDLVIVDVLMPGLSGPELLRTIDPEIKKKSKIALMSAYTGDFNEDFVKTLGADIFIAKPFEDIFKTLDSVLLLIGESST
jgi:CheY-like chemotaxis protein